MSNFISISIFIKCSIPLALTLQVQTYHRANPRVPGMVCACGATVRYKNEVFRLTMCDFWEQPVPALVTQVVATSTPTRMRVLNTPDGYTVCASFCLFPKGLFITH